MNMPNMTWQSSSLIARLRMAVAVLTTIQYMTTLEERRGVAYIDSVKRGAAHLDFAPRHGQNKTAMGNYIARFVFRAHHRLNTKQLVFAANALFTGDEFQPH